MDFFKNYLHINGLFYLKLKLDIYHFRFIKSKVSSNLLFQFHFIFLIIFMNIKVSNLY